MNSDKKNAGCLLDESLNPSGPLKKDDSTRPKTSKSLKPGVTFDLAYSKCDAYKPSSIYTLDGPGFCDYPPSMSTFTSVSILIHWFYYLHSFFHF